MRSDWFDIRKRLAGFGHAFAGVAFMFRTQFHAWVHLLATLVVVTAGIWLSVSPEQWCLLVLAIGMVWASEAANTAVESLVDLVSPEHHELAGRAKDVAAAAVLFSSIAAAVVGTIVFGPRLL